LTIHDIQRFVEYFKQSSVANQPEDAAILTGEQYKAVTAQERNLYSKMRPQKPVLDRQAFAAALRNRPLPKAREACRQLSVRQIFAKGMFQVICGRCNSR
jgi:hypothetical protein